MKIPSPARKPEGGFGNEDRRLFFERFGKVLSCVRDGGRCWIHRDGYWVFAFFQASLCTWVHTGFLVPVGVAFHKVLERARVFRHGQLVQQFSRGVGDKRLGQNGKTPNNLGHHPQDRTHAFAVSLCQCPRLLDHTPSQWRHGPSVRVKW